MTGKKTAVGDSPTDLSLMCTCYGTPTGRTIAIRVGGCCAPSLVFTGRGAASEHTGWLLPSVGIMRVSLVCSAMIDGL